MKILNNAICTSVHRSGWKVLFNGVEYLATINNSYKSNTFPVVGDKLEIEQKDDKVIIKDIIKRKNELNRNNDGHKQTIAANIDVIFITTSLNRDFNIARLERFYAISKQTNAKVVFVLTKADIADNLESDLRDIRNRFPHEKILVTSAIKNIGLEDLKEEWRENETAIFIGSSGVGKSTIINSLSDKEIAKTNEINSRNDKGRHTTTGSTYYLLKDNRIIIDSPGIRGVGIFDINSLNMDEIFPYIEELSKECKFRNCSHTNEVGCKIKQTIDEGYLDNEQYIRYLKFQRQRINEERRHGFDEREDYEKEKDLKLKKKSSSNNYKRR